VTGISANGERGFWHTEFGPLNQVVHVYPYDDLQHRTRVRTAMAQDAERTAMAQDAERNAMPGGGEFIAAQEAEIVIPAPFMRELGSRNYGTGNVYEMRTYTYAPGDIPKVLDAWGKAIEAREKFSPLAAVSPQRPTAERKGSLRHLHPQILRGGARPGIQFAAGAARGLRGVYHQPAPRRLGVPAHGL
jgi:hypothetical protein